jgi:predicted ABC-type transport system involved in lysophospholipase L1 biosynthesis ATPase subunit
MTILVATHDAAVAERCERIVRLEDGRVLDA